ncbi:L-gulonolactone D-arabinono-1,4-lactone oxidase [Pholiota conissans]|uniref:D-arabinono-1,4-lactone oxidase n=1 Tax=Pholiota conissans TaxID=109636 RepID=A0A9P5Z3T8_9AGAR|nr:L-gulonolactone D-arabinono-1,4-lactone oxidase [Pholiota conissans]
MADSTLATLSLDNIYERLAPVTAPRYSKTARFTNWGMSFTCTPAVVFEPEDEAQCVLILELARRQGKRVRVAGIGHSPSDLACTDEYMLRTTKLNKVLEVNTEKCYVIAQAGIVLNDLHVALADHNLAMSNLGSISDQTLGGVIATATHGTGTKYPVLSTSVLSLTILLADGSRQVCSRTANADLFMASLCGLGVTGLVLNVQLEVEKAFRLREVQTPVLFDQVLKDFDKMAQAAEHVRLWWFPATDTVVWSKANRTEEPKKPVGSWLWDSLLGYHAIQFLLYVGRFVPRLNITTGKFAAWLVNKEVTRVDDSYKIFNVDCRYPQHTTEWAIPQSEAVACLRELRAFITKELKDPHGVRPHFPVEIRFSASDDIWLSPSYGKATCWIGIVQYKPYGTNVPYRRLFRAFEDAFSAHHGRPHWAKAHRLGPSELTTLYPHFGDFLRVMQDVDPKGVLRNPYARRHLLGEQGEEVGRRVFKERKDIRDVD